MRKNNLWVVFSIIIISISFYIVSGTQTYGPELTDKLALATNFSDLIVYGKTLDNETKWVDNNILTLNKVQIYDIIKQNSSLNVTVGSTVPIYVWGGRVSDPVQAAVHHGIGREQADWEYVISPDTTLVYFLKKNDNGMYHMVYVENIDPTSKFTRSNLTELKSLVHEIMLGHPVPERNYNPPKNII